MKCSRCKGMMVRQIFEDLAETGDFFFYGWRCVNCGEIIDSVIVLNRGIEAKLWGEHEGFYEYVRV